MSLYQPTPQPGEGEEYTLRGDALRFYDAEADAKIVTWREGCLTELGFTPFQARTMAIRRDIDLHDVARMVKAGAQHRHVVEIVL